MPEFWEKLDEFLWMKFNLEIENTVMEFLTENVIKIHEYGYVHYACFTSKNEFSAMAVAVPTEE